MTIRKGVLALYAAVTVSMGWALYPGSTLGAPSSTGTPAVPTYAGFSAIDPSRNDFIVVGDTRGKNPLEFWAEKTRDTRSVILEEIGRRRPAFVVNLGDLVLRGGSARAWDEFDRLHADIRNKRIPYFPILGNHELRGGIEAGLRSYFKRFPHLNNRKWYSFTWKNTGLIMLDSNVSALTLEEQADQVWWYNAELERFEADDRIEHVLAFTHEPPFTNRAKTFLGHESSRLFSDPFLRFKKTRLLFSGHVHSYEHIVIGSKHFIVSGGGGAPRGKLVTDPEVRRYEDQFQGGELRFFHFCVIEPHGDSIVVKVLGLESDGTFRQVDRVSVTPEMSS